MPDKFNTNISHQLCDYQITFVNSQHENTNTKDDFVLKKQFKRKLNRFLLYKKKSDSDLV